MLGRRRGGSGVGLGGCWGRALHHAAFPPPPASVRRVPTSLCQEPSLLGSPAVSCPALFVFCLTSLNASSNFFHKETVPAKGSSHYSRKHFQLLAVTKNPTTNRKGYMNQHQQQVTTLLPLGQSCPTPWDVEQMPLFQLAQHSSNSPLQEFSPATSLVAAHPEGHRKGGEMWGLGVRTSLFFLRIEQSVLRQEVIPKQKKQDHKEWA